MAGVGPLLCRNRGSKKSPSGLAPEGQSRENDQNPRGASATTAMETTEEAATETWALREAEIVEPGRFI